MARVLGQLLARCERVLGRGLAFRGIGQRAVSAFWAVGCLGSLGSILRLGLGDVGPSIQRVGIADTVRLIQIVLIADQGAAGVVRRVTFDGLVGRNGSTSRRRADS
jgi:hypothetical protein